MNEVFAVVTPFAHFLVLVLELEMIWKGALVRWVGRMKAMNGPGGWGGGGGSEESPRAMIADVNINLLPIWYCANSVFSAKPWKMKTVLSLCLGEIRQGMATCTVALGWPEGIQNWAVLRGEGNYGRLFLPHTVPNFWKCSGCCWISNYLGARSIGYFVWMIRRKMVPKVECFVGGHLDYITNFSMKRD